ncbi:unnamed protein product, partial [marine sediment metagenome]
YKPGICNTIRKKLQEELFVDWLANNFMCFERNIVQ